MKLGSTFETAVCINCLRPIEHEWWGNGGNQWVHLGTGLPQCERIVYANPDPDTIRQKEKTDD